MADRHTYFAYGSNLCVQQMAQRCPDAVDPLPATLADHDWLINERGVATVEPFVGSEVHGVLWHLSDRDLATLDSAEGVPVDSTTWQEILTSADKLGVGAAVGAAQLRPNEVGVPRAQLTEAVVVELLIARVEVEHHRLGAPQQRQFRIGAQAGQRGHMVRRHRFR